MRKIIIGSSLLSSILPAVPQVHTRESVDVVIHDNGTERQEVIDLSENTTYSIDSLPNDRKAKSCIDLGKDYSTSVADPEFSDSIYIDQFSRIPTVMEMSCNEIVHKFIDMCTGHLRNQVTFMLSACNFYTPISEETPGTYGSSLELKHLPIIESTLNSSAVSRVGTSRLW